MSAAAARIARLCATLLVLAVIYTLIDAAAHALACEAYGSCPRELAR